MGLLSTMSSMTVWILVGWLVVTIPATNAALFCRGSNPLIDILAQKDVHVYLMHQRTTTDVCRREWASHGTCCEVKSLLEYVKQDTQKLQMAMQEAYQEVLDSSNSFKDSLQKMVGLLNNPDVKTHIFKNVSLEQVVSIQKSFADATLLVSNQSEQVACFSRINSLRTNSLCYTCSGRSEYFFNEGRALMSMQDCRKTISVCGSTWRAMVNLVDATATISRFYEQFKAQLSINSQDAHDKQFIVEFEE